MGRRRPDGAAPYLLTPSTLPAVSSPVPANHLRALRVRAIEEFSGAAWPGDARQRKPQGRDGGEKSLIYRRVRCNDCLCIS